jgi:hypothetical protein
MGYDGISEKVQKTMAQRREYLVLGLEEAKIIDENGDRNDQALEEILKDPGFKFVKK